jgi:galactokinase
MPQSSKTELLKQLDDKSSHFSKRLEQVYSDKSLIEDKKIRLRSLLETTELSGDAPTIITRCPGRISFSKHADYINNDLLYCADDRDILVAAQLNEGEKSHLSLINKSPNHPDESLDLETLFAVEPDKNTWTFYIISLFKELLNFNHDLKDEILSKLKNKELILAFSSDLPSAGGLSSSHALILSSYFAITGMLHIEELNKIVGSDPLRILKLCQNIENARGFKSGLGDPAAQLLSKKDKLLFIKLFPQLRYSYIDRPSDLGIITAPSFIKADKSLPEFRAANENIAIYKEINSKARDIFKHNSKYLGDLLYEYSDREILEAIQNSQELDHKSKGLALYGLAEGARVRDIKRAYNLAPEPQLDTKSLCQALGRHLNKSHEAEKNFYFDGKSWQAMTEEDKYNYDINPSKPLGEHAGIYRASTLSNDKLQYLANQTKGVYGSSISGAGLGGNNTIVCSPNKQAEIKETLINQYYINEGLEARARQIVHISTGSNSAGRLT